MDPITLMTTLSSGAVGPATSSVALTFPASEAYAADELHARLGLVGGSMARAWIRVTHAGTVYAPDFAHGGSSADSTAHVAANASATRIAVTLGSGYQTGAQVAASFVAAFNTATSSTDASADGATVTINNASNLVIPDDVDTTDMTLAGMQGVLREVYETSVGIIEANSNGGTDSTFGHYVRALSGRIDFPAARAMRVVGFYCAGHTGYQPRMAFGTGQGYSANPGAVTIRSQGVMASGLVNGEIGTIPVSEVYAGLTTDDGFWLFGRGDTATSPGGTRYRLHGQTLEFDGDLQTSGVLVVDTAAAFANTDAFGATYDITASTTYNIYITMGVIFEMADASGNYPANGRIRKRFGSHLAENAGTQFIANAAQLDTEVTSHRFLPPSWQSLTVTSIAREYDSVESGAGSRAAFYQFPDLNYPSTTAASLLSDMGSTGTISAPTVHVTTLATPVELGLSNGSRTDGQWVALTWNYVPSTIADFDMPVYLDEASGDDSWIDMWTGSSRNDYRGHTSIPGYSGRIRGGGFRAPSSDANEYRSTNITGMPHDSISEAYPSTWVTDATDDTPAADANEYYEVTVAGMVAA